MNSLTSLICHAFYSKRPDLLSLKLSEVTTPCLTVQKENKSGSNKTFTQHAESSSVFN